MTRSDRRVRALLACAAVGLIVGLAAALSCRPSPAPGASPGSAAPAVRYHCPMHPSIIADKPGDCPICGMRLVPIEPSEAAVPSAPTLPGAPTSPGTPGADLPPSGYAEIRVAPERQQLIGAKTTLVVRKSLQREVRAVARIVPDETLMSHVHTKVDGYVEKLYANATGQIVHQGDPLLEIYSPELLATQEEYLVALRSSERAGANAWPSLANSGTELVASARRRLLLLDMTEEQVAELDRTRTPLRTITIVSPASGYILMRNVTVGERVSPGANVLDIADLSRVWVIASLYEDDLPSVHTGQAAAVTLSYLPGEIHRGHVALVYPTLDPATRTGQVRIELPNPGNRLKPEMYAQVAFSAGLGDQLVVPPSAVIETGNRSIVFLAKPGGFFEPREVQIGARLQDAYEVRSGLAEGDAILATGAFLFDAESRIRAAQSTAMPMGNPK